MQKEVSSPHKLQDQACVQQNSVYLKEENLSQKNPWNQLSIRYF